MSPIDEIKKLQAIDVLAYVGIFMATVTPGFLTVLLFRPDLVLALDIVKLLILCFSVTLPAFAVSYVVATAVASPGGGRMSGKERWLAVIVGASITGFAFYGALLIVYLADWPFRGFLAIAIGLHAVIWLSGLKYAGNLARAERSAQSEVE